MGVGKRRDPDILPSGWNRQPPNAQQRRLVPYGLSPRPAIMKAPGPAVTGDAGHRLVTDIAKAGSARGLFGFAQIGHGLATPCPKRRFRGPLSSAGACRTAW